MTIEPWLEDIEPFSTTPKPTTEWAFLLENPMTPEQKLKHKILLRSLEFDADAFQMPAEGITADNVNALYDSSNDDYQLQDAVSEVRCSGEDTTIPTPSSRHYEAQSVAAKMPDGSWVGWTYWYGGGKHGEPDSIDWMDDAYDLNCTEEEKLVVVRTFHKKD